MVFGTPGWRAQKTEGRSTVRMSAGIACPHRVKIAQCGREFRLFRQSSLFYMSLYFDSEVKLLTQCKINRFDAIFARIFYVRSPEVIFQL
jgi:hypothetical protein